MAATPKSGRGGARKGAGRKAGGVNRLTAEAVARAKASGELPGDILLEIARIRADAYRAELSKGKEADDDTVDAKLKRAEDAAEAAAPYFNARLASVEHKGNLTGGNLLAVMLAHAEQHGRDVEAYRVKSKPGGGDAR